MRPQTTITLSGFDQNNQEVFASAHNVEKRVESGLYKFNPEKPSILNSSLKNNPLSGTTLYNFLRLLYVKRHSIDWWRYKHRILALAAMGLFNSFLCFLETCYMTFLMYNPSSRKLIHQAKNCSQAPVFIIGHPRTGTTLLHSLLALDEERFTFCDTFIAGFPHCFLFFERMGKYLFADILSETRPMDNMKLHFDLPQEDELATNLLSGFLVSPYTSISFMRDEDQFRKYQCFLEHHGTNKKDTQEWSKWFLYLLDKIKIRDLLLRNNEDLAMTCKTPRRLLLKSPCHTGRARLLLKLFPDAKFVFIHRDPYEVFLSGAHMASTTYGYWFLQEPSDAQLQEYILKQGEILHDEYFSCVDDGILNDKVSKLCDYYEVYRRAFQPYLL